MSWINKFIISGFDIHEMPTRYVEELRKEQSTKLILQRRDEIIAVLALAAELVPLKQEEFGLCKSSAGQVIKLCRCAHELYTDQNFSPQHAAYMRFILGLFS